MKTQNNFKYISYSMHICKTYCATSKLTSPQTFILLCKVFLLPRFNIDIQAVIWLPCKHTYTHKHRLMGIHINTQTHPWTTSQKHRSHASESPLHKTAGSVKPTPRKDVWSIYSGDSMRT